MEEVVLRFIKEVGFPIACACFSLWACYKMFLKLETNRAESFEKLAAISEKSTEALQNNTAAMAERSGALEANTAATDALSARLKMFGSDPQGLCRAQMALKEAGIHCKAEEVIAILKQQGKLA